MRILILTPKQPHTTGNWVTATRYAHGLEQLGATANILAVDRSTDLPQEAGRFEPDIIHLLHAYRTGLFWLEAESLQRLPMTLTLTGTDIHRGAHTADKATVVNRVLTKAVAVFSQNRLTTETLRRSHPELKAIHYLPPGIELGTDVLEVRKHLAIPDQLPLLLHPASIRPVKRNLELLQALAPAAEERDFHLAFCGPVLDANYGTEFQKALENHSWATYLGELPSAVMPSVMRSADLILNHSASEGLSNALVEAAALGRPILAHKIQGNQAVVEEGVNGSLYDSDTRLQQKLRCLLDSPDLRKALSRPDPDRYSPRKEAHRLLERLTSVLTDTRCPAQ